MQVTQSDRSLLLDFITKRRSLILRLQEAKGLKASGLSARLLRADTGSNHPGASRASSTTEQQNMVVLIDEAGYFDFQEYGRGPGKASPFKKIYDWLAFKKYGLDYKDDAERKQLAWKIIAIHKKYGSRTHRTKPTGVLSEAINQGLLDELSRTIAHRKGFELKTDSVRLLS